MEKKYIYFPLFSLFCCFVFLVCRFPCFSWLLPWLVLSWCDYIEIFLPIFIFSEDIVFFFPSPTDKINSSVSSSSSSSSVFLVNGSVGRQLDWLLKLLLIYWTTAWKSLIVATWVDRLDKRKSSLFYGWIIDQIKPPSQQSQPVNKSTKVNEKRAI